MRKNLLILSLFISSQIFAQTGIGTTTPNASAKLDVYATNKGFLPPRVTLTSSTDATTIASPAEGLLVYNLGSVGLQAGYYYWNGANWATIATASSAGNGVTATDMVKLYGEAWSSASGKIGNSSTGFAFTVPVSGKYLFDFSSITYGSTSFTINFYVRQGTSNIGSDGQVSTNNGVRVEYNGKVEVNLQAGVSYNVYVSSSNPNRGLEDYDRVYYKMVAGNLPVTGQTVEYGIVKYTGNETGALTTGSIVQFDATASGNLSWSANKFTLKANKTYELESYLSIYQSAGGVAGVFQIYDYTNSTPLANGFYISINGAGSYNPNGNGPMRAIVTPTSDITVGIKFVSYYGSGSPGLIGSTNYVGANAAANQCYFMVKQIGSSAIVDPWVLSGNNAYNTTGNVGIGNNAPTQALDVTGTGKFSTSIINSGTRTYFGKDGSNMHWFATTDAVAEANNLGYGFESNGSSIQSHRWNIGGGEKMRISSSGNVGIGTVSPARKLHLQTSDNVSFYIESTTSDNNGMVILNANTNQNWGSNWHEFLMFQNQGSTIGSIAGSNGGNMVSYNTSSDYRLKTDLKNYNGLDLVNKIKTYDFAWKRDSSRMYGVMAHELQSIIPYAVSGTKDAVDANGKMIPQSVDYGKLTPILVKAIQEQDSIIKNQSVEINKLIKEKASLEKSMNDIQRRLLKLENKKN